MMPRLPVVVDRIDFNLLLLYRLGHTARLYSNVLKFALRPPSMHSSVAALTHRYHYLPAASVHIVYLHS